MLFSCARQPETHVDHRLMVLKNAPEDVSKFTKSKFEKFSDLNLGFYRGNLWLKLEIENHQHENVSYMFVSNDRFNRSYTFYKIDTIADKLTLLKEVDDLNIQDHRTYNHTNPNFKIDLEGNERANYLITTSSDGRSKDANARILTLESYFDEVSHKTIWGIVFYSILVFLLVINLYLWSLYGKQIYLYYVLYMASTLLVYLGIEGYLNTLRLNQLILDHIVFVSLKLWVLSLIMYTAKFFGIESVAPRFYKLVKLILIVVLGGTFLFEFIFYSTSIQFLHFFENVLTILWLLIVVGIILYSAKSRRLELKYYLIPFGCFILFTVFGIINLHLQLLPGDSFTFVKLGAIFEFIGFTYFITLLIKRKIKEAALLEISLKKKEEELKKKIDSTDLISVFNIIENTLSTETEWMEFKERLKTIKPRFLEHLMEMHPKLSKSEIRLLTLIRLEYSQKEIATILNIAPESVKKARSRARKKLLLDESIELKAYLEQLD